MLIIQVLFFLIRLVIVMIGNVLSTLNRNRQKSGAGPSRKMLAQASAVHVFIYVLGNKYYLKNK